MTPAELVETFRILGRQDSSVVFTFLADHICNARLANGARLLDLSDVRAWFLEAAECAHRRDWPESVELSHLRAMVDREIGPRPKLTGRTLDRRTLDSTCPRCGHIHEGVGECGMAMGNGRHCRCEMEVA